MSDQRVTMMTEKQLDAMIRRLLMAEARIIQTRHELEALKLLYPSEAVAKVKKRAAGESPRG